MAGVIAMARESMAYDSRCKESVVKRRHIDILMANMVMYGLESCFSERFVAFFAPTTAEYLLIRFLRKIMI